MDWVNKVLPFESLNIKDCTPCIKRIQTIEYGIVHESYPVMK